MNMLKVQPSLSWMRCSPLYEMGRAFAIALLLVAAFQIAVAQEPTVSKAPSANSPVASADIVTSSTASHDERYRIGPGDVIEIRIFRRPELSREAVRVDARGMIRMPLIPDYILVACQTEGEISQKIATLYLKYLLNPQVDVFVREYQSQPVAVIGAVNSPGRFQLQRRVRLLELLAFAGGPAERAGTIQIVHNDSAFLCEDNAETVSANDAGVGPISYKLKDTLGGNEQFNPYVRPGDIITLPESDQVYVVGNVHSPRAIPLKETVTVSSAIAMAGGTMRDTKNNRIRVIRQVAGGTTKTEIFVDLKAIEKRQAEDIVLQANDIVDVPTSAGKSLLRGLSGMIFPTLTQLPVRAIP